MSAWNVSENEKLRGDKKKNNKNKQNNKSSLLYVSLERKQGWRFTSRLQFTIFEKNKQSELNWNSFAIDRISSTSHYGGNQVNGLPPASSSNYVSADFFLTSKGT